MSRITDHDVTDIVGSRLGIPSGYRFVRFGTVKPGEMFIGGAGTVETWAHQNEPPVKNMVIVESV